MDKRILIVEPDPKQSEKNTLLLSKEGYALRSTDRALEAIRTIQDELYEVLIMDVGVKDMAWDEALPIIKGLDPDLPIIMTSNDNTPTLESAVLRQKPFYYHVKTFGTDELLLAVQNAVDRSRAKR
jgi:two-component system nitrogen regulation response regulator NtrX